MSRKVLIHITVLLSLVGALLVVPGALVSAADDYTIGMSLPSETDSFFVGISNGAEAAATDLGVAVVIKTAENDPAVELANVEALIVQGVDALVISPVAGSLNPDVVNVVNEAGIPLVVTGAQVDMSQLTEATIASVVLPYDKQGGWLAASLLCEAIGSAGNVLEVIDSSAASLERSSGFNRYMTEMCTDASVQVLDASALDADGVIDAVADALMGESAITGVMAYTSDLTLALVDAAVVARAPATVHVMGFDATDDVMVALQDGHLAAVVTPVGWLLGSAGIEIALNVVQGNEVEASVMVNMGVLDLDSVMAFRSGPGEDGAPDGGDPREGNFESGGGGGNFESGGGGGNFESGGGGGNFESGGGGGNFESGGGGGNFESGGGGGNFESGGGGGNFESDGTTGSDS